MFRSFKNSRLGKYYSAVFTKYGVIAPTVTAIIAYVLLASVELFGLMGKLSEASPVAHIITIVVLALLAVLVLYSICAKLTDKNVGILDFVIFVASFVVVVEIIKLIFTPVDTGDDTNKVEFNSSIAHIVLYIVALVLLAAVTIGRLAFVKHTSKKILEQKAANATFGSYFKAFVKKFNIIIVAVSGVVLGALLYLLDNAGIRGIKLWNILVIIMTVLGALILLVNGIKRLKAKRINEIDPVVMAMTIGVLLFAVSVFMHFSVLKLVLWLVALVGLVTALVLVVLKTYVEEGVEAMQEAEAKQPSQKQPCNFMETFNPVKVFAKDRCVLVAKSVKNIFVGQKDAHYISSKDSRRIAKENMRVMKEYESRKKRKNVPESEYVTKMRDDKNIVEFENLHTYFFSDAGVVKAVNGVTFDIPQGSTVGVIGESGCGKSVTSLSLMQLVQAPKGQVMEGSQIRFKSTAYKEDEKGEHIPIYEVQVDENGNELKDENGEPLYVMAQKVDKKGKLVMSNGAPVMEKVQKRDSNGIPLFETEEKVYNVAKMPTEVMRKIRGREITMIFQEPMTSLNPIFTIGQQLDEVVLLHIPGATKESAKARTYEMLQMVGIIPENVYERFPHELSGGMRQRVMIAMALSCHPKLIIADEPTTALDVTIQAQILDLLRDVKQKINGSIMFITHDLGVIAEMADFVVVMYAGRVIEMGTAKEIFDNPMHPYTMGLQKSKPAVNKKVDRLYSIPGSVPNPINMPNYCYFRDRCDKRCKNCDGNYPEMIQVSETHKVSCHLYEKEDN